jgi:hypothetical protein
MIFIAVLFLLMIGYVLGNYGAQACATSHDELTEQKTILIAIAKQQSSDLAEYKHEYNKLYDHYVYAIQYINNGCGFTEEGEVSEDQS